MITWLKRKLFRMRLSNSYAEYGLIEPLTTTDATPTTWPDSDALLDTSSAGSAIVRYTISARDSSGAYLFAVTTEGAYVWPAAGPSVRISTSTGQGVASANNYAFPRPSLAFDPAACKLIVTGKASTTIVWSGKYKILYERN